MRRLLILALLQVLAGPVAAERLLLVQGYLGDGATWQRYGVSAALERAGWAHGGHLAWSAGGPVLRVGRNGAPRRYYTLDLPTEAPLLIQARLLSSYLDHLDRLYGEDAVVLAGHSAGGVVGRLLMVQQPERGISALVTFASPHLGTGSADLGKLVGQSPLAMITPFLGGGTVNRSQGLYHDLAPESSGNLLFWLNRQRHPRARYVSVVRVSNGNFDPGDLVVPAASQDMNRVAALRGHATRIDTQAGHLLSPADGELLVRILNWLATA